MVDYNLNVGGYVTVDAMALASKPKWMDWQVAGSAVLRGNAKLPSGYRRLIYMRNAFATREEDNINVYPVLLPDTDAGWRMVIYASDGSYIIADGLTGVPTIGTPQVRLTPDAPAKATVHIPILKNMPGNILDATYAGWSDGHAEAVSRGMEITVEYRDASTNTMVMVFRGMIYQIESGEVVTITAYDRLMDLAQYSDQYQSSNTTRYLEYLNKISTGATTYDYIASNEVGAVTACTGWSIYRIDCLSQQAGDMNSVWNGYVRHPLPMTDSKTPVQGSHIRRLSVKAYAWYRWSTNRPHAAKVRGRFILYKDGAVVQQTDLVEFLYGHTSGPGVEAFAEDTLTFDVDWAIDDNPSRYEVGAYISDPDASWGVSGGHWGYEYTTSWITITADTAYKSSDGVSWSQVGNHPEISIDFDLSATINTSNVSTSGVNVYVQQSAFPVYTNTYISTVDSGFKILIDYFIQNAAGIRGIVNDLLKWAGMDPDVINDDMGQTTYYTSSTYDYLTCIQELLRGGNYGMMDTISSPGHPIVRKRHSTSETGIITFTTAPDGAGVQAIISHELTAHWMAEKATQAYIAENATSSGLPIALETDDALMDNSLVEIMQSPLRSIIADNTLGTHDLMANASGGKMVQLHTNVFEGKMVLAGYRLDIWDFTGAYVGGNPIDIDIPEYGASGTAVPTEIVIADGVTHVSLDNIRRADRSEVARSMGLTADAISNNASSIPSTVYIFARMRNSNNDKYGFTAGSITAVDLLDDNATSLYSQTNTTYIKVSKDSAGYTHIVAVFPASDKPAGYATTTPISQLSFVNNNYTHGVIFDNPKFAYGGQNVHVDIRVKSA